jgi:hypothetical protein
MKFFTVRRNETTDVGNAYINPQCIVSIRPKYTQDNNYEVIGSMIRVLGDEIARYDDYRKPEELLELLSSYHHQSSFLSL